MGIIIDSEDGTVEIKYSGTLGATFGTSGLNLAVVTHIRLVELQL